MQMRHAALLFVALLPALSQAAGTAGWSDQSLLTATTLFGPNFAIDGAKVNGEAAAVGDSRWSVSNTIVAKSVMTGADSFFPTELPTGLKVQHLVPDSTHPNLAFWYTPEVFDRDGAADGSKVMEWKSVANICHDKHAERGAYCTAAKIGNSQVVSGGNNVYVASLQQATSTYQPIFKKSVANGHGVVRFQRQSTEGASGAFLELVQRCADNTCAAASATKGWGADAQFNTRIVANGMTVLMVVRMMQSSSDYNNMGILHLNAAAADKNGFALYATESKCMPTHWGSFTTALQTAGLTTQIIAGTGLSIVKLSASASPTPSKIMNQYSGMTLKIFGSALNTNTNEQTKTHTCTINKYLFGGITTAALASGASVVTILGGAGSINGMSHSDISNLYLAVGCTDPTSCTTGTDVKKIASIAASGTDTAITVATTLASNQVPGTQVYVCLEASGANCIIASLSAACSSIVAPAADGTFEIWKDATSTGAPSCPAGKTRQFSTFNTYLGSGTGGLDDNSCASECATATQLGCNKETGDLGVFPTCAAKQGTLTKLTDPNEGFKIVAVTVDAARTAYKGFINGFHEGCDLSTGFDGCAANKITPPIYKTGAAAAAFANLRLGALDAATTNPPVLGFASMDLAEMMVYDKQLTPEELDRLGSYMADKYSIDDFIVNDDVRSPFRTKALSLSAGCGPTRRVIHSGILGKGFVPTTAAPFNAAIPGTWYHNLVSLESALAIDKTDYYKGATLTITGGNDNIARTIMSASGQSCVITAYAATTKVVTCDLTHQGDYGFVKYATDTSAVTFLNAWRKAETNAVEASAAHSTLFTTWRPADFVAPFHAVIGNPASVNVEVVRVTAAVYSGTDSVLTVVRAVGGTPPQAVTNANSIIHDAKAKITYCKAFSMGTILTADTYILVSGIGLLYDLPTPTGMLNWYAKLVSLAATPLTEIVQVTAANAPTFKINAQVSAGVAAIVLKDNAQTYTFSILAGDKLSVACATCGTGEIVTVNADVAKAGLIWTLAITPSVVNAAGFATDNIVTLVERKSVPSPSILVVVRAREGTTALNAIAPTLPATVDFMYMPQNLNAVGAAWVDGSGVSTYKIDDCDKAATPHSRDAPIQTFTGPGFLKNHGAYDLQAASTADALTTGASLWYSASQADSSTSSAVGPAAGGQVVVIKGWNLFPLDVNILTAANAPTGRYDVERMENYLLVTVGERQSECRDPTKRTAPCMAGTSGTGEQALQCQIIETGAGYCSNDFTVPCRCLNRACSDCTSNAVCNWHPYTLASTATLYAGIRNKWAMTRKPTIQCRLPSVLGSQRNDLNIYWHGIRTTLTNWYTPEAPVVSSIKPASASYMGGAVITINGRNFGPKIAYTSHTSGGAKTAESKYSKVEIHGKSFAGVCATTWVSDKQLLCTVPQLPARKTAGIDTAKRTVEVQVVVSAQGSRSSQSSLSILTYAAVPTYFTCEYKSTSEAAKRDCFTCCRSACIVDEFALGGVKGGSTFSHCDSTCYSYCGYTTVSRRRLMSAEGGRAHARRHSSHRASKRWSRTSQRHVQ